MFSVVCHSNVGFLAADPQAIKNFREDLDLEQGALNFFAAGNSTRFVKFIEQVLRGVHARGCRICIFLKPTRRFIGVRGRPEN